MVNVLCQSCRGKNKDSLFLEGGIVLERFSSVPYMMFRVCMSVCLTYETAC